MAMQIRPLERMIQALNGKVDNVFNSEVCRKRNHLKASFLIY